MGMLVFYVLLTLLMVHAVYSTYTGSCVVDTRNSKFDRFWVMTVFGVAACNFLEAAMEQYNMVGG